MRDYTRFSRSVSHGSSRTTYVLLIFPVCFFLFFIFHITAEQLLHLGPLFQILASVARRTPQGLHVSVRFAAQSAVVRITVKYYSTADKMVNSTQLSWHIRMVVFADVYTSYSTVLFFGFILFLSIYSFVHASIYVGTTRTTYGP